VPHPNAQQNLAARTQYNLIRKMEKKHDPLPNECSIEKLLEDPYYPDPKPQILVYE